MAIKNDKVLDTTLETNTKENYSDKKQKVKHI